MHIGLTNLGQKESKLDKLLIFNPQNESWNPSWTLFLDAHRMAGALASARWCSGSYEVSPGGLAGSFPGGWAAVVEPPMGLAGSCGLEMANSRWWVKWIKRRLRFCFKSHCWPIQKLPLLPFPGLRGETHAAQLFLVCLSPTHLQQTAHVP